MLLFQINFNQNQVNNNQVITDIIFFTFHLLLEKYNIYY
jgi:hypothetical protein